MSDQSLPRRPSSARPARKGGGDGIHSVPCHSLKLLSWNLNVQQVDPSHFDVMVSGAWGLHYQGTLSIKAARILATCCVVCGIVISLRLVPPNVWANLVPIKIAGLSNSLLVAGLTDEIPGCVTGKPCTQDMVRDGKLVLPGYQFNLITGAGVFVEHSPAMTKNAGIRAKKMVFQRVPVASHVDLMVRYPGDGQYGLFTVLVDRSKTPAMVSECLHYPYLVMALQSAGTRFHARLEVQANVEAGKGSAETTLKFGAWIDTSMQQFCICMPFGPRHDLYGLRGPIAYREVEPRIAFDGSTPRSIYIEAIYFSNEVPPGAQTLNDWS